ncbi:MAG: hypothetical protein MR038_06105 [Oscillospiraceae bacterium]|nr:hypothetical protein [Oscillospiraceae bacterium]
MKKSAAAIAAAIAAALILLTGCGSGQDNTDGNGLPSDNTASATQTVSPAQDTIDLKLFAEASKTSKLLEKYGSFSVSYSMDYGELLTQNASFFLNSDGSYSYVNNADGSVEFFDGVNDYWQEEYEDMVGGYAYLSLPGSSEIMDLEGYIFTYSDDDGLVVTDYTRTDDGGYIISASENYNDSYEDADGSIVSISYKYEYVISATADYEVTGLKCTCTDVNSGEVDSTLEMSVEYEAAPAKIPEFMDETFVITVIVISGDSEVTSEFEVPMGFQPYFSMPSDGDYQMCWDREGTQPVEDTMAIDSPCMIYAIKVE